MIITPLLVVLGSVAGVSTKLFREKRQADKARLVLADRAKSENGNSELALSDHETSTARQLMGLSSAQEKNDEIEKKVDFYFKVSLSSLALCGLGTLFYSPLILLSIPGLVYVSVPFFQDAYENWHKDKKVGVALVDAIGIGGAVAGGFFLASSLASALIYYSQKVLISTQDRSRKGLVDVVGELPQSVFIEKDGIELEVPFDTLEVDDVVVVDAGQMIPVDGEIIRGKGAVDQRALTGESQPVEKQTEDEVFASTVLLTGRLYMRVKKTGKDSVAAQIGDVLNSTADYHSALLSRGQKIVDKGALPTLVLGGLALPLLGLQSAIAILIASFGFSMRVAAPIAVLNFLRITSDQGILVKDGRALELLSKVDTVVFDKTGTLTEEIPSVGKIYCEDGFDENDLLTWVAAIEQKQKHPLALALLGEAKSRGLPLLPMDDSTYEIGYGISATVDGKLIHVGSMRYMDLENIVVPEQYREIEEACYQKGYSLLYVSVGHKLAGLVEILPTIRPETEELIKALHARNIETVIISGDQTQPTQHLAGILGIDRYFAEVLPQNKAQHVEQLQSEGRSVCFVGDGINDSIALKAANVGISMSGASTIATDTAGIVLMDGTLKQLIPLFGVAKELDTNLTLSTALSIIPGMICVGGVFFLNLGLFGSVMIFNSGLAASIGNAFLPLAKHKIKHSPEAEPKALTEETDSLKLDSVKPDSVKESV